MSKSRLIKLQKNAKDECDTVSSSRYFIIRRRRREHINHNPNKRLVKFPLLHIPRSIPFLLAGDCHKGSGRWHIMRQLQRTMPRFRAASLAVSIVHSVILHAVENQTILHLLKEKKLR